MNEDLFYEFTTSNDELLRLKSAWASLKHYRYWFYRFESSLLSSEAIKLLNELCEKHNLMYVIKPENKFLVVSITHKEYINNETKHN